MYLKDIDCYGHLKGHGCEKALDSGLDLGPQKEGMF